MNEHHYTEVNRSLNEPRTYGAYCKTCGWVGYTYDNKRDAENDADEHCITMARGE